MSDEMTIVVSPEQAAEAVPSGGVILVHGTDTYSGDEITFAGDHRPMGEFLAAIIEDGHAHHCEIEPWQVLGRRPA